MVEGYCLLDLSRVGRSDDIGSKGYLDVCLPAKQ